MHRLYLAFSIFIFCNSSFAAQIIWEVEHPYRYYRYQSDLEMHRWALEELQNKSSNAAKYAPISHMERKLNNPSWWTQNRLSDFAELRSIDLKEPPKPTERMIQDGWASFLRSSPEGNVVGTCWNEDSQNHSACDDSDTLGTLGRKHSYINPKYHRVVLTVTGPSPDLLRQPCRWEAPVEVFLKPGSKAEWRTIEADDCSDAVVARIPYGGNDSPPITLSVALQNGETDSTDIKVRDFLVFGLGDSYSSGEGNPEVPAKLHKTRAIGPIAPRGADMSKVDGKTTFYGAPRRAPVGASSAAEWTDRRCHRSVYSYQNRVALQLAIAPDSEGKHHHAVTFFHFSCSGAEVTEDILYAWEGRECSGSAQRLHKNRRAGANRRGPRHLFYMPQISKASVALCGEKRPRELSWLADVTGKIDDKKGLKRQDHYIRQRKQFRKTPSQHCGFTRDNFSTNPRLLYCKKEDRVRSIDLLLSSAGGNDVGFSGIIANTIVTARGVDLIRPFYPDTFVDEASAKRRLEFLPHRLKVYDRTLETFLGLGRDKAKEKPIVAMLYPNLIYQRGGKKNANRFCPEGNIGMDVSNYLGIQSTEALETVERLVEGERIADKPNTYDGMIKIIRDSAKNLGWRAVEEHRRAFMDHGICTSDAQASPNESDKGAAEKRGIPYKRVDLARSGTSKQYSDDWRGFNPVTDLYPYETRKTWFRTPNQDYMNIHYFKGNMTDEWKLRGKKVTARFLANRILGGSFHPTAEGHSHIADHVYCEAREKLFGESCDPAKVTKHAHKW